MLRWPLLRQLLAVATLLDLDVALSAWRYVSLMRHGPLVVRGMDSFFASHPAPGRGQWCRGVMKLQCVVGLGSGSVPPPPANIFAFRA